MQIIASRRQRAAISQSLRKSCKISKWLCVWQNLSLLSGCLWLGPGMRKKLNLIRRTGSFIYQNKEQLSSWEVSQLEPGKSVSKGLDQAADLFLFGLVFSFFFRTSVVSPVTDRLVLRGWYVCETRQHSKHWNKALLSPSPPRLSWMLTLAGRKPWQLSLSNCLGKAVYVVLKVCISSQSNSVPQFPDTFIPNHALRRARKLSACP